MHSNTIYIDLKKLYDAGKDEASLIVRLMVACNDITLANHCMSKYKYEELIGTQEHVRKGALLYFVKLQCGHLNESLPLIKQLDIAIQANQNLKSIYEKCTQDTKDDFLKLRDCLEGNINHDEFKRKVESIRHKTAFHYQGSKLFKKSINKRANNPSTQYSSITMSDDLSCLRFNVADEVADTLVCNFLWKISDDRNLQNTADEYSDFGSELCKSFVNFCVEFVFRYIKEKGAR